MKWLLLLAALVALAFVLGMRAGAQRQGQSVAYTPVVELPEAARTAIDEALDERKEILAIKLYREATGAGLAASKAAVEAHERRRNL